MAEHKWERGYVTSTGEWTPWFTESDGFLYRCKNDGTWVHNLQSHPDEPNPDLNHIHVKFKQEGMHMHSFVLCSVKVDGMREINRRELIEDINRSTGLNLSYR